MATGDVLVAIILLAPDVVVVDIDHGIGGGDKVDVLIGTDLSADLEVAFLGGKAQAGWSDEGGQVDDEGPLQL